MIRERLPIENEAALRSYSPVFTHSALCRWMKALPPQVRVTPKSAHIEATANHPEYGIKALGHYFRSTLHIGFTHHGESATPEVRVTGRRHSSPDNHNDIDLLTDKPLVWRRIGYGALELIAPSVQLRAVHGPRILSVEVDGRLEVANAEQYVADVHNLLTSPLQETSQPV